jgi:AcrR family transcriptional regulator
MADTAERIATEERFLDAAERLLIEVGYATISTRRLAEEAGANHGLDAEHFPLEAMTALVITFNEGIILERLGGITAGQTELLATIDRWLVGLQKRADEKGHSHHESTCA